MTITPADPGCIRVVQITDLHVLPAAEQPFKGVDSARTLERVLTAINADTAPPDLILVTGDLVHKPVPEAYARLRALLERADFPLVCLPGNHDLPELMRSQLDCGRISTARRVSCGEWVILLLDSVVEGREHGYLGGAELEFLEQQLRDCGTRHVAIAVHHHPVNIGSPWMDAMKLANGKEFLEIVKQHPRVKCILWGHIHQEFRGQSGEILLIGTPSTCLQFKPETQSFELDILPPAYRKLELWRDGRISTSLCWLSGALAHDSASRD